MTSYGRELTVQNAPTVAMEFGIDVMALETVVRRAGEQNKRIYLNENMHTVDVLLVQTFPKKRPW